MEGADGDAPATVGSGIAVPDTARMVIGGGLEPRAPARAQTIENEVMGSARSGLESETLTSEMQSQKSTGPTAIGTGAGATGAGATCAGGTGAGASVSSSSQ